MTPGDDANPCAAPMNGDVGALLEPVPSREYTLRDLRAADVLALTFTTLGLLVLVLGLLRSDLPRALTGRVLSGIVLVMIGVILNRKVQELLRTGGREGQDEEMASGPKSIGKESGDRA